MNIIIIIRRRSYTCTLIFQMFRAVDLEVLISKMLLFISPSYLNIIILIISRGKFNY